MLLSKSVTTEARYEIISRNNLQAAGKFSLLLLQCIGVLSSDIMNHKSCLQVQEEKKNKQDMFVWFFRSSYDE